MVHALFCLRINTNTFTVAFYFMLNKSDCCSVVPVVALGKWPNTDYLINAPLRFWSTEN